MRTTVARAPHASEGNDVEQSFHDERDLETAGNSLSRECLNDAIDHSGIARKVLAAEMRMKDAQFSKSLSGAPGGDFNYVLDHIRPSIRLDYARRLAERERDGGLEDLAAEALAQAAIRYLSTRRIHLKPAKASLR